MHPRLLLYAFAFFVCLSANAASFFAQKRPQQTPRKMNDKVRQTARAAWSKIQTWSRKVYAFLTSMFFLKNFAAMIGVLSLLSLTTFYWLRCYTRLGESVQVPDFTGMPLEEVRSLARARHFELTITDSVFIVGKEPGVVLEQNPAPLSRVKEGRTIYLTVTKSEPDMVQLPSLTGAYDYNQYARKLKRLYLKPRVKERVFDPKQASNTILYLMYEGRKITEADLKKGVKVPMGSEIEAVVTERGANTVEIPNVVCMTFEEAAFTLTSANLILGRIEEDDTVFDRLAAYVVRQEPAPSPGARIQMGQRIDIWLSQARPAHCPEPPSSE